MIGPAAARPPSRPRDQRRHRGRAAVRVLLVTVVGLVALVGSAGVVAAVVPGVNWPVQSLGDRGTDVLTIQRLLRVRLAAEPMPLADGLFGSSTVSAVKTWQARRGLAVTGIVDGPSWAALVMPLKAGATGEAVLALQVELREKRRATMAVDGTFGATTTAAVVSLQKIHPIAIYDC